MWLRWRLEERLVVNRSEAVGQLRLTPEEQLAARHTGSSASCCPGPQLLELGPGEEPAPPGGGVEGGWRLEVMAGWTLLVAECVKLCSPQALEQLLHNCLPGRWL